MAAAVPVAELTAKNTSPHTHETPDETAIAVSSGGSPLLDDSHPNDAIMDGEKKAELMEKEMKELQENNKFILKRNTLEYALTLGYILLCIYVMAKIATSFTERNFGVYSRHHHIQGLWM